MTNESFAQARFNDSITLKFHPKYAAREFGVDYGKRYHLDPLYRVKQERKAALGYHRRFGRYGMGDPNPQPDIGVAIQPLDFMNAAMGGRLEYHHDESVWTPDKPLSQVHTLADVEKLGDIDWERHPLYLDLFRQLKQLQDAFASSPVAHVQGVHKDGTEGNHSLLVMHTPYTTAFRLMGERILEMMMLEEEVVLVLLTRIMRQYENLWAAICQRMGWTGTKIHFGDCAATMLSPRLYEHVLLPLYAKLMVGREGAVIHSCGPSTHLLKFFRQVPRVRQLQLGDGTDLALARELFPECAIEAYYEPGKLMVNSPAEIEARLGRMRQALRTNYNIACGGADPDTPAANVTAFLEMALKHRSQPKTYNL